MEQPGAKREMGGHRYQMWGPGTTGPRWQRPWCEQRSSTDTSEKSSM